MAKIYRPIHGFSAPLDGVPWSFTRETLVEEGHPILDAYGTLFEELEPHFKAPVKKRSVEAASAAPGEKRNR